jgi:hypothetical protein
MGALTVAQLLTVLRDQKDIDAAIELCERSVAVQDLFGKTHTNTSRARCQLTRAYLLSGRAAEALAQAEAVAGHYRTEAEEIARIGETVQAPAE